MSAPQKRCCRSAVVWRGDLHFSFSSLPWFCWRKSHWVWQVQAWVWIVGFQIFEAPRDFSKIRSWPWAMRSKPPFFLWDVVNLWRQHWWRHNTDSCGWWKWCRRWAMTSGSARTLCDMTQPKRELPKSPFFQMAPHSTWIWKRWGRFFAESSPYSTIYVRNLNGIVLLLSRLHPRFALEAKVCLGHQLHAALHVSTLQSPCRSERRLRVSLHEMQIKGRGPTTWDWLYKQLNTNA